MAPSLLSSQRRLLLLLAIGGGVLVLSLFAFLEIRRRTSLSSATPSSELAADSPPLSAVKTSASSTSRISTSRSPSSKSLSSAQSTSSSPTSSTSSSSSSSSSAPPSSTGTAPSCFPLGTNLLSSDIPTVPRSTWWCADADLYGFLGFSYPLEEISCSAASNSFDKINKDFANMRATFGATMVRVYAPECRELSVWENLVKAARDNGMGVIAQVWWGFGDQSLWQKTQDSIYELFTTSSLASIAPFIVHSASFGSEPIGDFVDQGNFVTHLKVFKTKLNGWGIPVGISEDWDRTGSGVEMMEVGGGGLGSLGKEIKANTDQVHAHIMPYYHTDVAPLASDGWAYTEKQLAWLQINVNQPIYVTESQWASYKGSHGRGSHEDQISLEGYRTNWAGFLENCAVFKKYEAGWFLHVYSDEQEGGFGLLDSSMTSKIVGFKPERC